VPAPFAFMADDRPEILDEVIAFGDDEGKACLSTVLLEGLQPALVLGEGMDVGIVPEGGDLEPRLPPMLKTAGGAGGATAM
jgi:hypothetical protein